MVLILFFYLLILGMGLRRCLHETRDEISFRYEKECLVFTVGEIN